LITLPWQLQQLLEEREQKLESVLSVASSLLAGKAVASKPFSADANVANDVNDNAVELKRFLLADALDQQSQRPHQLVGSRTDGQAPRRSRYAALVSVLLVSAAAAGVAAAVFAQLDLGGIAEVVPRLF
jgi:hypothetical protein